MISKSIIEEQKNLTSILNEAQDENQFLNRYNKVLGRKNDHIREPIFDETTNDYIFEDIQILEKSIQHNIEKISERSHNASFLKK